MCSSDLNTKNTQNPWQEKVYKNPIVKKIISLFLPKEGSKEYKKVKDLLKDAASPLKMEWVYVNRICIAIITFIASIFVFIYLHQIAIDYVYTQPTTDYNLLTGMTSREEEKAMELTKKDNIFLDMFRGKTKTTEKDIQKAITRSKHYKDAPSTEIDKATERIYKKLQVVNSESFQWFELL